MSKDNLTLAEMIKALGCKENDPDITEEHFPILPRDRESYDLGTVYYDEFMTSRAIHEDLARQGLGAGDIADLCEYGTENPEEQRKHIIEEIGSIWDGDSERHRFFAGLSTRKKTNLEDLQLHDVRTLALYHDGGHFPYTHILVRRPK